MILVPSFLFQSAKLLATMPLEEVGTVPGSYRIVDMFCLREVLNQIMKVPLLSSTYLCSVRNISIASLVSTFSNVSTFTSATSVI